jgi:hypothetical protein
MNLIFYILMINDLQNLSGNIQKNLLWPEIVAKIIIDLINLSESGAGNYSIFSMALRFYCN